MATIEIKIKARDLLDSGHWTEYCDKYGLNEWAMNEGLMSSDEMLPVFLQEAKRWNLLKDEEKFEQISWGT